MARTSIRRSCKDDRRNDEAIAFVQTRRNPLIPAEAFRWDKTCVELLQIFDVSVHTCGRTWTQVKGLILRMSLVRLTSPSA